MHGPRIHLLISSLGVLLASLTTLAQTSIVAIRTRGEIAIAADTLAIQSGRELDFCKIIPLDRSMFFAAAGTVSVLETPYDLLKLVKTARQEALRETDGSLDSTNFEIRQFVTQAIYQSWDKTSSPDLKQVQNRPLFEYVLFGIEKGEPALIYQTFSPLIVENRLRGSISSNSERCPGDCRDGLGFYRLGQTKAIDEFLKNHVTHWSWRMELYDKVRFMVMLEILDRPNYVRAPVNVLRLTKDGTPQWIEKTFCEPSKTTKRQARKPAAQ